ncbi:hypothetical protein FACS1894105_06340 [Clostridia bacterium]|nr:hypothetical protein FACS1894105_06340 [Clostridia bacterium]
MTTTKNGLGKKILALVLTAAMVFGITPTLAPITAYAAGDVCEIGTTQYTDLADALEAVHDGETIKLLKDIDYEDNIKIESKNITFDLNTFTLDVTVDTHAALYVINGWVTLTGSGEFNVTNTWDGEWENYWDGCAVYAESSDVTVTNAAGVYAVYGLYSSIITVQGDVTIIGDDYDNVYIGVEADDGTEITVAGDIINTITDGFAYAVNTGGYGSSVSVAGDANGSVAAYEGAKVEIGGDINASGAGIWAGNDTTIFVGGNVTVSDCDTAIVACDGAMVGVRGDVTVYGEGCRGILVQYDDEEAKVKAVVIIYGKLEASGSFGEYIQLYDVSRGPNEFETENTFEDDEGNPNTAFLEYTDGVTNVLIRKPGTGAATDVTFTAEQVGGASGLANSTGILITFDTAVSGLTADEITVTGAAKGAFTDNGDEDGATWLIGISGITVDNGGDVSVSVSDFGAFHVTSSAQDVTVYKTNIVLSGTASIELNAATGELTANTSLVTGGSAFTYAWSGAGVTNSGAATLAASGYSLGSEVTLTVTATDANESVTAAITAYKVNIAKSGNAGADDAAIAAPYGEAGDTIPIAYTVATLGSGTDSVVFSGGTVANSGNPATYTISAGDATDGIITITAAFNHAYVCEIGNTKYTSLADALATAGNVKTIYILESHTLSDALTIPAGKSITITGKDNTIMLIAASGKRHFIVQSGTGVAFEDVILDGGYGEGGDNESTYSGGIENTSGSVRLASGAVIQNCAATSGGGIYSTTGTVTLAGGSVIQNCLASTGGGIYNFNDSVVNIESGAVIQNNEALTNGGGVYNYYSSTLNLSGEIKGNKAVLGGGIYNRAPNEEARKGTINIKSGGAVSSNTSLSSGGSGDGGGGVYNGTHGMLTVETGGAINGNTAKSTNSSPSSNFGGGGICNRGTVYVYGEVTGNLALGISNGARGGILNFDCVLYVSGNVSGNNPTATTGKDIYSIYASKVYINYGSTIGVNYTGGSATEYFEVVLSAGDGGDLSAESSTEGDNPLDEKNYYVTANSDVTFTAAPGSGFQVKQWSVTPNNDSGVTTNPEPESDTEYSIISLSNPVKVEVAFENADAVISIAAILGVTSPVANAAPNTAITNGTGFTAALTWDSAPAKFAYGAQYTATITLTATSGYTFSGGFGDLTSIAGFTVNSNAPTAWVSNNGTALVFKVQFPATDAALSGEIDINNNKWNSSWNTVTFGLFAKNTQNATVMASGGVGAVTVEYYLSATEFADTTALETAASASSWQTYSSAIALNPKAKYIVYVKLTDTVGGVAYLNSGGVVLYVDNTVSPTSINFTKSSGADKSVMLTLNDNTLASVKNGENALTLNTHYTLSGSTLTFAASYLETLNAGSHMLTLNFDPLGVASSGQNLSATIDLTVNAAPTYTVTVMSAAADATGGGSYIEGATVTIDAGTAPNGMQFKEWTTSDGISFTNANSASTAFTMIASAVTVTANFEAIPAIVTGVTVNPPTVTVEVGTSYQFGATVNGTNNPAQSVIWTLDGYSGSVSSISADGLLTVGAGEMETSITVKAASMVDGNFSGTATVTVSDAEQPVATVTSVTVTPATITLNKGDSYTFSAAVDGTDNPSQSVTWSVTGGVVGTTITSGALTVDADETAATLTITATSTVNATQSGTAIVTIAQPVPAFVAVTNITGVPSIMTAETPLNLSSTVEPTNATNKIITWSVFSAGGTGAAISGSTLTATTAGSITVRATITNGLTAASEYTQNFSVTVNAAPPTTYAVTVNSGTANTTTAVAGANVTITADTPPNGQQFKNWTTASSGVTFTNANSANTTFTMPANAVTVTANFEPIPPATIAVTGVTLNQSSLSLYSNTTPNTATLTATVVPANATVKTVTWTSGNPAVATVDQSGNVTAVANGTAVITVTTTDGGKTASCTVTVSTYTNGNGGDPGTGNSGIVSIPPTTTPTTLPAATVVTDDGKTVSAGDVKVNTETKTVEVVVNQGTIKQEIASATDNVKIVVPAITGTNTAEVGLVVQNVTDMNAQEVTLTVQTPVATLTFNSGAQQAIAAAGKAADSVVIAVSTVAKADLPTVLRDAVPDNAVIVDFSVTVGTKVVSDFGGGSVSVTIPYTLPAGVKSTQVVVYYLNDNGNLELVVGTYNPATKTVELSLRHFSRYVIKINDVKYTVGKGWYNADSLDFAVQRGLVAVTNGIVEPTGETSRADFVVSALKALGIQPYKRFKVKQFSDVSHLNAEQQAYLLTARELGVINGVGGDKFDPDSPALREHFFQILSNIYAAKLTEMPEVTSSKTVADFADGANVPAWAIAATNELIHRGVIQGDGSKLQIGAAFNNATTAVVLAKLGGVIPNLPDEAFTVKEELLALEPKKPYGEADEDSGDDIA